MFSNKRIIVAPLHWGLGHATRCIPIIKELKQNNTVALASDGESLELLKREFSDLEWFQLPSYNIKYTFDAMIINMMIQGPSGIKTMRKEKKRADEIAKEWKADILISDNRFGFRSEHTKNIYITHQLCIPANNRMIAGIASRVHRNIIQKFDECWVPDHKGAKNLGGKLSQVNLNIPTQYIGPQSRMQKEEVPMKYHFTAVLSGPEPQRTRLENTLVVAFKKMKNMKLCLVRGTNEGSSPNLDDSNIDVFNLLNSEDLNQIMNASAKIICRSGYSSIMDLIALEKPAILIPTVGQYEQEYLAERLNGKFDFEVYSQKEISQFLQTLSLNT